MYGSLFCRVYNEFGWNVYPEVFGEQLLRWLSGKNAPVKTALDLGCGTGVLCQTLERSGIDARGVDLSEGMIAIARERAPSLRFDAADMVTYRPAARFDLVTCTGDALNHIFDRNDVRRVMENVYEMLAPDGYFVFDLLGEQEIPDDEPFTLDYSDTVRAVFATTREPGDVIRLHIDVYENGQFSFEENILEKLHNVDDIRSLLTEVGFAIEQCGHRLLPEEGADAATWFFAARKENR